MTPYFVTEFTLSEANVLRMTLYFVAEFALSEVNMPKMTEKRDDKVEQGRVFSYLRV